MIPILYENEDVLVANKPEGLASIPERDQTKGSVLSLLSKQFQRKLYVVHRLDKEVSGVILFAKNADAHRYLNNQFFNRNVRKIYVVLTHGIITKNDGTINAPLRQYGSGRMGVDHAGGKASVTKFRVTQRFDAYSLVKVQPVTGRRHQIRVHFYHEGFPVVGDLRYGDRKIQRLYPRLMLHARSLTWSLPSGESIEVEASIPASFQAVLKMLSPPDMKEF